MCERASPSASQMAFIGHRPWATRVSAQSTFFGGVLHGLFEDLVLQGFLPSTRCSLAISARVAASSEAGTTASPAETAVNAPCRSSLRHWNSRLAATPL